MTVTPQLAEALATSLAPLVATKGHIGLTDARRAVGQAQRLAQIVPEAQPWAATLWAALTGATQAATSHQEAAPWSAASRPFQNGGPVAYSTFGRGRPPPSQNRDAQPGRATSSRPPRNSFRRLPLGMGGQLAHTTGPS